MVTCGMVSLTTTTSCSKLVGTVSGGLLKRGWVSVLDDIIYEAIFYL
jgi:hypothetical protein